VAKIDYAVDVWDLRGVDPRLDSRELLEHLQDFGREGWELVWFELNVDLANHDGPCHVLAFKRAAE
jgi:hypothetical protein